MNQVYFKKTFLGSSLLILVILEFAGAFLGVGCSSSSGTVPLEKMPVQVLSARTLESTARNLQDPADSLKFEVAPRRFLTVTDLVHLKGDSFELFTGGELKIHAADGSIVQSENYEGGQSPEIRYFIQDGVVIPKDYESLFMLSTYYQFEQVLEAAERVTGLTRAEITRGRKIPILFYPRIRAATGEASGTVAIKTNAAFDPGRFSFLILPSTRAEDIPLGMNLQVIAHEFGHLLFEQILRDQAGNLPSHEVVAYDAFLNGLNEGFADFFSYTVTGSTHVLGASLSSLGRVADRNFSKIKFKYSDLERDGKKTGVCSGDFYCYGTLFAEALYFAQEAPRFPRLRFESFTFQKRGEFFREVYEALGKSREALVSKIGRASVKNGQKTVEVGDGGRALLFHLVNHLHDDELRRRVWFELNRSFGTEGLVATPGFSLEFPF